MLHACHPWLILFFLRHLVESILVLKQVIEGVCFLVVFFRLVYDYIFFVEVHSLDFFNFKLEIIFFFVFFAWLFLFLFGSLLLLEFCEFFF
jgi:hypothetical protein